MTSRIYSFCPLCGNRLVERVPPEETKTRNVCPGCGYVHYRNPAPAAGVIVIDEGRVLLVRRKYEPRSGLWGLPAGFVEAGEDVAACAVRETKEETNLDVEIIRLFNVYSAFDDPRAAVVLILYLARCTGGEIRCGDDASEAAFFPLDDLPADLAFRAHREALWEVREGFAEGTL